MCSRNYRWLKSLSNRLHKTQQKTLLAIVGAVCMAGVLRSLSVAEMLARMTQVKAKSALQRFYRFVDESKIDPLVVWRELTCRLLEPLGQVVISVDWTEWRFDLRVLAATVSVGRRAVPILAQTFTRAPPRSQNCRENTFLRLLASFSPSSAGCGARVRPGLPAGQPHPASA